LETQGLDFLATRLGRKVVEIDLVKLFHFVVDVFEISVDLVEGLDDLRVLLGIGKEVELMALQRKDLDFGVQVLDQGLGKLVWLLGQGVDEVLDIMGLLEGWDDVALQFLDLVSFVVDFLDDHFEVDFLIEVVLVIFGEYV
jgi:hypothetical protein